MVYPGLICFATVHFEVPTDHRLDLEVATDAFLEHRSSNVMPEQSMEEAMTEVVLSQKRILDQWCFAEHYPPAVLPQVWMSGCVTSYRPAGHMPANIAVTCSSNGLIAV